MSNIDLINQSYSISCDHITKLNEDYSRYNNTVFNKHFTCLINKNNEDYKYKYLGTNIIKAYGEDLTGLNVNRMAAPEAGHLAEKYETVLALKRPVIDEGEITLSKIEVIKYRQILLPFGDDGINISSIFGGMSYKVEKGDAKKSFFSFFKG